MKVQACADCGPVQIVMGYPGTQASLVHDGGIDTKALAALAEVLGVIVETAKRGARPDAHLDRVPNR